MKVGIICSGGGNGVFDALNILFKFKLMQKDNIKILSDRNCLAYKRAIEEKYITKKIEFTNREYFSENAYYYFSDCDFVILNYGKIVSHELYSNIFTVNNHPSILPSYKGAKTLYEECEDRVRFSGVTMHMVNGELDSGKIISQCIIPVPYKYNNTLSFYKKIYYLGVCYNVLLIYDLMINNYISVDLQNDNFEFIKEFKTNQFSNPCLENKDLQNEYDFLYKREIYDLWE